jgi:hypothetical protein
MNLTPAGFSSFNLSNPREEVNTKTLADVLDRKPPLRDLLGRLNPKLFREPPPTIHHTLPLPKILG